MFSSASCWSCLFCLFVFGVLSVSSQLTFPCATPALPGQKNAVSAAEFSHHHPQYPIEWYYATGTLCEIDDFEDLFGGCRHPIGYQLTEFLVNTTLNGVNLIGASAQLAVSSNNRYQINAKGLPVETASNTFNLAFASAAVKMSFAVLYGKPGDVGTIYQVSGSSPNATIDLILRAATPLMYDGFGGFAPTLQTAAAPGQCSTYYYFSLPKLSTFGNITLNGVTKLVYGTSWFDHQWGADPFTTAGLGWIWMGLHVRGHSLLVFIPRNNKENLLSFSWINIQAEDGTQTNATVTSVTVLNTWTSPYSGVRYPIELSFYTNVPEFQQILLTPVWQDQESASSATHYWEGYVIVTLLGGPHTGARGSGYLELVGPFAA